MSAKPDPKTSMKLYIVRVSPCCRVVWLYALQVRDSKLNLAFAAWASQRIRKSSAFLITKKEKQTEPKFQNYFAHTNVSYKQFVYLFVFLRDAVRLF